MGKLATGGERKRLIDKCVALGITGYSKKNMGDLENMIAASEKAASFSKKKTAVKAVAAKVIKKKMTSKKPR